MMPVPHEVAIGEVYLPPLLVTAVFGFFASVLAARLLNRYQLSRRFFIRPHCGGEMRFPALIEEAPVIDRISRHVGA